VLAHVRSSQPSSVYEPRWVAFVAAHARGEGTLQEDVAALESAAMTHDALAEVQLLAWLFESAARTARLVDRPLSELLPHEVDAPALLPQLLRSRSLPVIEVLRAAAELEAEAYARLPPPNALPFEEALARVARAAPFLGRCTVEHVRPLMLRGRVFGRRIWVGTPCASLGPSAEHVAWQAAHEATVTEVTVRASALGLPPAYLPVERCALHLLQARAAKARLGEDHARWLAHFGRLPAFDRASIDEAYRALL
jgi:hypothetical protein